MRPRRLGSPLPLLAAMALIAAAATGALAQGECDARKKQCVFQRTMALFKCHKRAEDRGVPVDPNCLARADDKFGVDASAGCFADVEDTFPSGSPEECSNYDDTASIRDDVDGFVQDVIDAFGNPMQTECSKKPICVGKLVKGLLKCHMRADRHGVPVESACLDGAKVKFDGGGEPCKGCVRSIEDDHPPGSPGECPTFGDTLPVSQMTRAFVACAVARLADPSASCAPTAATCALPACVTYAGQVPDCGYAPVVSDPAYTTCAGPKILVDTTHANFHQITPLSSDNPGRYWGFARLLHGDGYDVRDSETAFSDLLPVTDAKILVIANAQECEPTGDAVPADDVTAVVDWVRDGGSLLLVLDHRPYDRVAGLLAALGIDPLFAGLAQDPDCALVCPNCPRRCQTFVRGDGTLNGAAAVADGPSPPATAVDAVSTFSGTAFSISATPPLDASYEPVLVFPPGSTARSGAGTVDIGGFLQGVAVQLGSGRVYVSGEAGGLTAQLGFGMQATPENERFLRNVIAWLDD